MSRFARSFQNAWPLYVVLSTLVLFRTLPFLIYGREIIDGDEGLFGVMAHQLSQGRAFPMFGYGSRYLLGINNWFAAPLMRVFGCSVIALKLPLLIWNLAVVNGLAVLLRRQARLGLFDTFLCCVWFALPSFMTSRGLMDAAIAGVETFGFLLWIWMLRKKPGWGGLVAGLGIIVRPFVFYGVASLWFLELRSSGTRAWRAIAKGFAGIIAVYSVLQCLARFSTNYFGEPSPISFKRARFIFEDIRGYFAEMVPQTLGIQSHRLHPPIEAARDNLAHSNHYNALGLGLASVAAVLLVLLIGRGWKDRALLWSLTSASGSGSKEACQFPLYLVLVGAASFAARALFSPPPTADPRYTYQLIFGFAGIYALQSLLGARAWVRSLAVVLALGCLANNLYANALGALDMRALERDHSKADLVAYLENHGIRAVKAEFYLAYSLGFLSGEEITATTFADPRMPANTEFFMKTPEANRAAVGPAPCPSDSTGGTVVGEWCVLQESAIH